MTIRTVIYLHLIFWICFIFLGVLYNVAAHNQLVVTPELYWEDLSHPFTWIGYGRTILVSYGALWVFDQLFSRKLYFALIFTVLALIVADVAIRYFVEQVIIGPVFGLWQFPNTISLGEYFMDTVFYSAIGIFLCFVLKMINDFFAREMIESERVQMELQFLKSQVNPHFLFNSFNSLYGLSLTEPKRTPDTILKMAELTRYMLYESNETEVPLYREVNYLYSLIELEKLRHEDTMCLQVAISAIPENLKIAPLLLIAFVENTFKHGETGNPEHPIKITLNVEANCLHFSVVNLVGHGVKDTTGGIGLKNVKRRLDLIYPGRYKLELGLNKRDYQSKLYLKL